MITDRILATKNQSIIPPAHITQAHSNERVNGSGGVSGVLTPAACDLTSQHYSECVEKRGLNTQWVDVNCRSATANVATQRLGYAAKSDGIWLEGCNHQSQYKPDKPWKSEGDKKAAKYRSPLGEYDAMLPAHPTDSHYWNNIEALKQRAFSIDGHPCLLLTEGFFKAIAGCSNGIPTIALLGVEMGLTSSSSDLQGKRYLVPTLERYAQAGFGFIIGFDADCATNKAVIEALRKLAHQLKLFKVPVYNVTGLWTVAEGKGMDDYIHNHNGDRFIREVMGKAVDISTWERQFKDSQAEQEKSGGSKDQPPSAQKMALEIAEQYQPTWAFDNQQKTWRVFNGKSWDAVEDDAFARLVYNVIKSKGGEWKVPAYVDNVIRILRWELMVEQWITFDRRRYIAFNNCVLDTETNERLEHSPGFRFTSHLPFDYHPPLLNHKSDPITALAQQCPRIYEYMLRAMDGDSQRVMKLLATINGALKFRFHDLQMFVHLVGKPGTGKGTFSRILEKIVGDANCTASSLTALDEGTEIAAIIGSQLVVFPDERRQVGIEILLKLTGGDRVRYREIYKKPGNSPFYGLLLVLSNNPIFAGDTTGLERRLSLIQFLNPIPRHLRDSKAEQLMDAEIPNLIPIALALSDSHVTSLIKGLGDDEIPAFKQQEWLMKCQTSSIAFVANDHYIQDPQAELSIGDGRRRDDGSEKEMAYGHYRDICEVSGLKPFSLVSYSNVLVDLLTDSLGWEVSKVRTRTGMKIKGLRLRQLGMDDHIPRIDESFTIDPPKLPDDTPPDNRPPGNPSPSTPDPSGEGLMKGCEGLCEGLKPALGKASVGFEGLNGSIDKINQQQCVELQAEVSQHQNIEETPYTPTQPMQGKGFNPSQTHHNPSQPITDPSHPVTLVQPRQAIALEPVQPSNPGVTTTPTAPTPAEVAALMLQCSTWTAMLDLLDCTATKVGKTRAGVFNSALKHISRENGDRQHLVRLLAEHIQQFPRDRWAYNWLPESSRKLKEKAFVLVKGADTNTGNEITD